MRKLLSLMTVILTLALALSLIFFIDSVGAEQAEQTPFQQMLQDNVNINSRESVVKINNVQYQKIEVEGETFYLVFKGRQEEIPYLLCDKPQGFQSEHLIEGTAKIQRRKMLYVKVLKESCTTENGQKRERVELDPQIGFYLPESSKDKIKNKQLGINPLHPGAVNFSGEF